LILVVLAGWVLLGPIGMAFDACAAMMALCDGGPCGVVAAVTMVTPALAAPETVAAILPAIRPVLPSVQLYAIELPPKSVRLSA